MTRTISCAASLLAGLLGCSSAVPPLAKQPDGSYQLACQGPLAECLERAEVLCRNQGGYVVVEARDIHELLGHEQGQSQVEVRKSSATLYCGNASPSFKRTMVETKQEPVKSRVAESTAASVSAAQACVPGATQACVGPGGCGGGQACAADGSRFEPCNCGVP